VSERGETTAAGGSETLSSAEPPQPTLTDGVVTLRPWRDDDIDAAVAGHDELIAHWYASPVRTRETMHEAVRRWRLEYADRRSAVSFAVEHDDRLIGSCEVRCREPGVGELSWTLYAGNRGRGHATRAVRVLADYAMTDVGQGGLGLGRVESHIEPGNEASLRVATRAGLRREGVRRVLPGTGERAETDAYVVLARLATDPPLSDPEGFRALLNSFLPRKRAISQLLVRDGDDRVLLCQLTYKRDWDLPGGVVEVGESPRDGVAREIEEELGVRLEPGRLLLTDWLPPWGGWDDALCLVFDGGRHPVELIERVVKEQREIRSVEFCSAEQVEERAADFTARRIGAALDNLRRHGGDAGAYTESGR
jgi:RimJ/RimL family protein N-acetyltransferase/8-oxo-dGTP pyrophosphatase MutT (NUDIX family)